MRQKQRDTNGPQTHSVRMATDFLHSLLPFSVGPQVQSPSSLSHQAFLLGISLLESTEGDELAA